MPIVATLFITWNGYLHARITSIESKQQELSLMVAKLPSSKDVKELRKAITELSNNIARMQGKLEANTARQNHL
jgi:uncharacterized coiled-coil protein SlyX